MKTTKTVETHTYRVSDRIDYTKMEVGVEFVDGIQQQRILVRISCGNAYSICDYISLDGLDEVRMLRDLLSEVLEGEQCQTQLP